MYLRASVLLLAMSSGAAAFAASANFERTLSVSGQPTVQVATGSGYIHVHAGSDGSVHVSAHLNSNGSGWWSGGGDLQSRINDLVQNPPIQQNGNTIVIGQRHDDRMRNVSIDYEVTVPKQTILQLSTGSGDIETQDVGASMKADSGSGSVRIRGLHGAATLQTGSGDIELQDEGAGDVQAQTGSGSIRLQGVDGTLRLQTGSGDIEAGGQVTGDSRLQTGSGSVRLHLGNGAHYTMDATTGSGSIRTQQPIQMQGQLNEHHVRGTVNGGGPVLRITSGSGDIEVN